MASLSLELALILPIYASYRSVNRYASDQAALDGQGDLVPQETSHLGWQIGRGHLLEL